MKNILVLILATIWFTDLKGQQILVDQPFNGFSYYGKYSKIIESEGDLPNEIQTALEEYLTVMFGDNVKNISFSHGQQVDLKGYFSETNRKSSSYHWLVPYYDLNYVLSDTTIGIKRYFLQMRLDEYGQLLRTNWPRKGYSNLSHFPSPNKIVKVALNQANARGYWTYKFETDLKFRDDSKSLNWVFKFPRTLKSDKKMFDVLEISLLTLKVVDEYTISTSTVN
ncbi:hypothetical protein [Algoriphagus vanfongensis]|uniref:hypothetical protein n=1 Tax=Algoriphagus vanfongensis TaxID=426371 RepID=UPI000416E6D0|nr:hypothetical protein [Algoriphagus vanfongensis]